MQEITIFPILRSHTLPSRSIHFLMVNTSIGVFVFLYVRNHFSASASGKTRLEKLILFCQVPSVVLTPPPRYLMSWRVRVASYWFLRVSCCDTQQRPRRHLRR